MAYDFDVLVIDQSEGCGPTDYEKVAASGVDGVIFRITEGSVFDDYALRHYNGYKAVGLPIGVYCWHNPSDNAQNNLKQADKVVEFLDWAGEIPTLGVWADYETDKKGLTINQMRQAIWKYIGKLDEYLKQPVGIYTRKGWWDAEVANAKNGWTDIPKDRKGWFANWNGKYPPPAIPEDWNRRYGQASALFWQYTNLGRVDGINASVDFNAFNGTRAEFNRYFGLETDPHPVPPPEPPAPPAEEYPRIITLTGNYNLRQEPGIHGRIITSIKRGERLKVIGEQGDWYQVSAWIHKDCDN